MSNKVAIALVLSMAIGAVYYVRVGVTEKTPDLKELLMQKRGKGPEKFILNDEEWRSRLTKEQYYVMRDKGTEKAFDNAYWDLKKKGTYDCAACDLPLFSSDAKYDSGTGWPSFWEPINPNNVLYEDDYALLAKRVEVLCARCESHIGHVFEDGPPPTGLRYCMNSIALKFKPANP